MAKRKYIDQLIEKYPKFNDKKELIKQLYTLMNVDTNECYFTNIQKPKSTKTMKTQKKSFTKKEEKTEKNTTKNKNFVGGGWDNTGKYGTFIVINVKKEKIAELEENEYGDVKLVVAARKEADERSGQDVMVYEG